MFAAYWWRLVDIFFSVGYNSAGVRHIERIWSIPRETHVYESWTRKCYSSPKATGIVMLSSVRIFLACPVLVSRFGGVFWSDRSGVVFHTTLPICFTIITLLSVSFVAYACLDIVGMDVSCNRQIDWTVWW